MTRIGPRIAVVQVEVDAHAGGLGPFRQLKIVVQIVRPVAGVHPQTLADRVDPVIGEDRLERLRLAVQVLVRDTGILLDEQGGDVGAAVGEGGGGQRKKGEKGQQHGECACVSAVSNLSQRGHPVQGYIPAGLI